MSKSTNKLLAEPPVPISVGDGITSQMQAPAREQPAGTRKRRRVTSPPGAPTLEATAPAVELLEPALALDNAGAVRPAVPKQPIGKQARGKTEIVLKKLGTTRGATLQMLSEATGWQAHSVRGFLSGTVRKQMGLPLLTETGKDGLRRYRLAPAAKA